MVRKYTRRQFIITSTVGIAAAGSVVAAGKIIAGPAGTELPNPYPVLPHSKSAILSPETKPIFFDDHQYKVVAALASLIVPTDDGPGATEAGVADYIDKFVAESEREQEIYVKGLAWIDSVSLKQYGNDFLTLTVEQQIELLIAIDEAETKVYRSVSGLVQRIDRKIHEIWNYIFGVGDSAHFFNKIRKGVYYGFYSQPISWKLVGYYGPPQPHGYPNFAHAPSPVDFLKGMRQIDDKICTNCHYDQLKRNDHEGQNHCMDCHEPHFPFEENFLS